MPTFAIYKILFSSANQRYLLAEDGRTNLDKAQEYLEEILDEKLPISKEQRDKTFLPLDNYVEKRWGRVTMMVVCNEKSHKYREKMEDKTLVHHPGCRVIIDNREGIAQMAIERSEAFNNKPDKVCEYIQDALCKAFARFEISVEIKSKMRECEFWDMVEEQHQRFKDQIRKVVFEFPNPDKVKPIDAPPSVVEKLSIFNSVTKATDAAKGSLNLMSEGDKIIQLKRTQKDFAQLVTLCSYNGYDISVHFKHYGIYRFGRSVKALDTIKEDALDEFRNGQLKMGNNMNGEFKLIQLLDEIRVRTQNFIDE